MVTKKGNPVVGIIEGGGTGPELADVFKKVISEIYLKETGKYLDFLSFKELFKYNPHSFWELKKYYYSKPYSFVKKILDKEVNDVLEYDKIFVKKKGIGMFRTAINAETLYYLRQRVKSVKVVPLTIEHDNKKVNVLFIRDQIQGYYTSEKIESTDHGNTLKIQALFSEKNFELLTKFAKKFTEKIKLKDYDLLFLYKFHIMGIELQKMIDKAMKKSKLNHKYMIMQPDSGMHLLLKEIFSKDMKNIVVICGNEIGDTLLETLILHYDLGTKETFYTSNFLLKIKGVEAIQTMHGSADDLAGKNLINPTATVKGAAHALEDWLKIPNATHKMKKILDSAIKNKMVTRDMGGNKTTTEVVDYILNNWK
jgi:hypothetical protein